MVSYKSKLYISGGHRNRKWDLCTCIAQLYSFIFLDLASSCDPWAWVWPGCPPALSLPALLAAVVPAGWQTLSLSLAPPPWPKRESETSIIINYYYQLAPPPWPKRENETSIIIIIIINDKQQKTLNSADNIHSIIKKKVVKDNLLQ